MLKCNRLFVLAISFYARQADFIDRDQWEYYLMV